MERVLLYASPTDGVFKASVFEGKFEEEEQFLVLLLVALERIGAAFSQRY